jgi:hypothetical protein
VQALVLTAQDDLMTWAASNGLAPAPQTTDAPNQDPADPGNKPLAFVQEAMGLQPTLGGNLLEALVLGGGALYAFNRVSGGTLSRWVNQLLPRARGGWAGAVAYERVIVVFEMESETGLRRLVAAKVTDERLEILAEQILPMTLSAAAAPDQADLERELKQLVKKVTDQTHAEHDLLLFDPKLKRDLPIYECLGRDDEELKPQQLRAVLSSLSDDAIAELRQWIHKPSSKDLSEHPMADRLEKRQRQLHKLLNDDKSRLVSLLELSLAMVQRLA